MFVCMPFRKINISIHFYKITIVYIICSLYSDIIKSKVVKTNTKIKIHSLAEVKTIVYNEPGA